MLMRNGQPVQYWACSVKHNGFSALLLVLGTECEMQKYVASEWYCEDIEDTRTVPFAYHAVSSDIWDELTRHTTAFIAPEYRGGVPF